MGEKSSIEWTDATWNPWQGCTKVSPACEHCYMFTEKQRYGQDPKVVVRSKPPTFNLPLKKTRDGEFAIKPGSRVFTCSWSDWFHKAADAWREEAWAIVRRRPDVTFQIVTKRTERIAQCLPSDWGGDGYPNVWLIATAENQEWMERRIIEFLAVPAKVHGLSIEPLLGPIDLTRIPNGNCETFNALKSEVTIRRRGEHAHTFRTSDLQQVDWVIVGGESGPGARPMHPDWVRSIRNQCQAAAVPFFFKQWGEWLPRDGGGRIAASRSPENSVVIGIDGRPKCPGDLNLAEFGFVSLRKVGKHGAGRELDGRTWDEFPIGATV